MRDDDEQAGRERVAPIDAADRLGRDLRFAIQAARSAGQRALILSRSGRWKEKTLGDVVDQACDALLNGLIEGRYPEDGLLTEEIGRGCSSLRSRSSRGSPSCTPSPPSLPSCRPRSPSRDRRPSSPPRPATAA